MTPEFSPQIQFAGSLFNQFVRVATPFFFLAAGYFFALSVARGAEPIGLGVKLVWRLVMFFVFWSMLYILVPVEVFLQAPAAGYWSAVNITLHQALSMRSAFLFNGSSVHLWFLPAMSIAIAMLAVSCKLRLQYLLAGVAVALYIVGLLGGAYKATPIGFDLGIQTRNGPFFSTIFVVTGYLIARLEVRLAVRYCIGLITLGVVMRIVELMWVTGQYATPPSEIDFLLGTYPFGVGIFLLLMATTRLGEVGWMVKLSRYSAGVYCAHMLFVALFEPRAPYVTNTLWELLSPFVVLAATFAFVALLSKVKFLRPVVT